MQPRITLCDVSMRYMTVDGETLALRDLNLEVAPDEFLGIVGPSGCGKSTLLSLITGLLRPTSGRVLIDGEEVDGTSPKVGYMLQHDHLFEWRSVKKNVCLGLEIRHEKRREAYRDALAFLAASGLGEFEGHYPYQLSGGMRQRAALARTMALQPEILLLDEPFSSLDYQTRLYLEDEVHRVLKGKRKTAVLVTHDIAEAIAMSDRIVVMSHRPGRIKAEHRIVLSLENRTPFASRQAPEFREFFRQIWEELEISV